MAGLTRAYPSAVSQSIPNATWTALIFGATRVDTLGMWVVGSPTRLTVPVGSGGTYVVSGTCNIDPNAVGARGIGIRANGATVWGEDLSSVGNASFSAVLNVSTAVTLVAGDYLELVVYQASGGALNHTTAAGYGGECSAALLT